MRELHGSLKIGHSIPGRQISPLFIAKPDPNISSSQSCAASYGNTNSWCRTGWIDAQVHHLPPSYGSWFLNNISINSCLFRGGGR